MQVSDKRWKAAQFAERLWWKNYLRKKRADDYLAWKTAYWEQLVRSLPEWAADRPGLDILDAGSGPAGIFIYYRKARVTAVDPLLPAYEKMPHFSPSAYPHVNFRSQRLENYLASEAFDLIFCINVINHVQNMQEVLAGLHASLRPGGKLVISSDVHRHRTLRKIFRLIPGDLLHPHQMDEKEFRMALQSAGFRIQEAKPMGRQAIFSYLLLVADKQRKKAP